MLLRNKETTASIFNRFYKENESLFKTKFRLMVFSINQTSRFLGKTDMDVMRELTKTIIFPTEMNNIIFDPLGNIKHYSYSPMTDAGNIIESDSKVYTVK